MQDKRQAARATHNRTHSILDPANRQLALLLLLLLCNNHCTLLSMSQDMPESSNQPQAAAVHHCRSDSTLPPVWRQQQANTALCDQQRTTQPCCNRTNPAQHSSAAEKRGSVCVCGCGTNTQTVLAVAPEGTHPKQNNSTCCR